MLKLERYSSFEEMDEAQKRDNKASVPASENNNSLKETSGQKSFKEFGELLRKGITKTPSPKK